MPPADPEQKQESHLLTIRRVARTSARSNHLQIARGEFVAALLRVTAWTKEENRFEKIELNCACGPGRHKDLDAG